MKLILAVATLCFIISACADKPCRECQPPINDSKVTATPGQTAPVLNTVPDRIKVFKYDGTLQCGMGKLIPIEEMKKEFKEIKIYKAVSKSDGQMRIQLCGSPSGSAHIFEIDRANLSEVLNLGFKEWIFE